MSKIKVQCSLIVDTLYLIFVAPKIMRRNNVNRELTLAVNEWEKSRYIDFFMTQMKVLMVDKISQFFINYLTLMI